MFLAPRQRKTTVFTRFWASASKNHVIYSVLWPGSSKNTGIYAVSCMLSEAFFGCQRHKNIVNYTIFTHGQYQQNMKSWPKIDPKTPNKDLQNASSNFTIFFPTPNSQKRENFSILKDFRGGSAADARPGVAKAMRSNHHRTASPEWGWRPYAADPWDQWRTSRPRTLPQHQNTMALRDGSGPRPCQTSLSERGSRTDGSGLRPAAQTAKRHFLNAQKVAANLAFSCRSALPP